MALDADPGVAGVLSQPCWLYWISAADQDVFDRSALACESVGWGYRRAGALDPVLRANLRLAVRLRKCKPMSGSSLVS